MPIIMGRMGCALPFWQRPRGYDGVVPKELVFHYPRFEFRSATTPNRPPFLRRDLCSA